MPMDFLRVEDLSATYQDAGGEIPALQRVSFTVRQGEFISIVGPSGCGKSTLLSILAGLGAPTGGRVLLRGQPLKGVSPHVGYMLQRDALLDWRTVWGNVTLGLQLRRRRTPEDLARAERLLRTYGLWEFRHNHPRQLSGGMRQRIALIRTLAVQPDLLLLDEAFSALDYQTRLEVTEDVWHIIRREGLTALMVTHDIPEGISMADRVLVLSPRPATVRCLLPLDFTGEDGRPLPPLARRRHPAFGPAFDRVWSELSGHA